MDFCHGKLLFQEKKVMEFCTNPQFRAQYGTVAVYSLALQVHHALSFMYYNGCVLMVVAVREVHLYFSKKF